MSASVKQLVQKAGQLATEGRWDDAERVWREVRRLEPKNPMALLSLGVHAAQRGDLSGAHQLLLEARASAPQDVIILMTLASSCRQRAEHEAELEAIQAALAVDAYFLPALLAKASWVERHGGGAIAAASMYRNALKVAPPSSHWPQHLRNELEHASRIVDRHSRALHDYLTDRLAQIQSAMPPPLRERWREAASIMAGRSKPYPQECNQLYVPRLPAIPFYEREEFPWCAALEAKTDLIREELLSVMEAERERFAPYIGYRPGDPVNQWRELNHSLRWSVFQLWRNGVPVQENLERCPETAKALAAIPMARIGGLCPNAMFSVLAPKTRIPPHNGETNARVVAHLPLIVPHRCRYRVGFEERQWRAGELLIFDDTIEHEAHNDSDELRVVLIFDLWNPRLTPDEHALVQAICAASREFHGLPANGS